MSHFCSAASTPSGTSVLHDGRLGSTGSLLWNQLALRYTSWNAKQKFHYWLAQGKTCLLPPALSNVWHKNFLTATSGKEATFGFWVHSICTFWSELLPPVLSAPPGPLQIIRICSFLWGSLIVQLIMYLANISLRDPQTCSANSTGHGHRPHTAVVSESLCWDELVLDGRTQRQGQDIYLRCLTVVPWVRVPLSGHWQLLKC